VKPANAERLDPVTGEVVGRVRVLGTFTIDLPMAGPGAHNITADGKVRSPAPFERPVIRHPKIEWAAVEAGSKLIPVRVAELRPV
jgi:hypothetical protein